MKNRKGVRWKKRQQGRSKQREAIVNESKYGKSEAQVVEESEEEL